MMRSGMMWLWVLGVVALAGGVAGEPMVDQMALAPAGQWVGAAVGPRAHAAVLVMRGSRFSVFLDGIEGPTFDRFINYIDGALFATGAGPDAVRDLPVVFSDDGAHCAYFAKDADDYVLYLDNKELSRGKYDGRGLSRGRLTFTAGAKHLYYAAADPAGGVRVVMDGKAGPASRQAPLVVTSPDGAHYVYTGSSIDVGEHWTVIDGKQVKFFGEDLKYDGCDELVAVMRGDGGATVQVEGKIRATGAGVTQIWVSEYNDDVAAQVTLRRNQPTTLTMNGTPVEGTEGATIERVFFSSDGRHYAAICTKPHVEMYVILDGRRGLGYQRIGLGEVPLPNLRNVQQRAWAAGRSVDVQNLLDQREPASAIPGYSPDSSKFVYLASQSNKFYIITNEQESEPYASACGVSFAGKRMGYIANAPNSASQTVVVDGESRTITAQGNSPIANVTHLAFSGDGAHYLYNMAGTLVVDGVEQAGINNVGFAAFSPDGQHIAQLATSLTERGKKEFYLDGKSVAPWNVEHVLWTADSKHAMWVQVHNAQLPADVDTSTLYVDGKATAVGFRRVDVLERMVGNWEVQADGLVFVARSGDEIKRYRVGVKE